MNCYLDLNDNRLKEVARLVKAFYYSKNKEVQIYDLFENIKAISSGDICILSPAYKWDKEVLDLLPQGAIVFGGNIPQELTDCASKLDYHNMMQEEGFVVDNARLTAEGFLAKLIENTKGSIFDERVLIIGSGRVAKALWAVLNKLGLKFDCTMRNSKELALSRLLCQEAFDLKSLNEKLKEYSVVINTVPAVLFEDCQNFASKAVVFELASIKCLLNEGEKVKYVLCPALPAKCSPKTAGKLIFDIVKESLCK